MDKLELKDYIIFGIFLFSLILSYILDKKILKTKSTYLVTKVATLIAFFVILILYFVLDY
jgi:hypothetical protein